MKNTIKLAIASALLAATTVASANPLLAAYAGQGITALISSAGKEAKEANRAAVLAEKDKESVARVQRKSDLENISADYKAKMAEVAAETKAHHDDLNKRSNAENDSLRKEYSAKLRLIAAKVKDKALTHVQAEEEKTKAKNEWDDARAESYDRFVNERKNFTKELNAKHKAIGTEYTESLKTVLSKPLLPAQETASAN